MLASAAIIIVLTNCSSSSTAGNSSTNSRGNSSPRPASSGTYLFTPSRPAPSKTEWVACSMLDSKGQRIYTLCPRIRLGGSGIKATSTSVKAITVMPIPGEWPPHWPQPTPKPPCVVYCPWGPPYYHPGPRPHCGCPTPWPMSPRSGQYAPTPGIR
jgi:hypothetical protein